MKSIGEIKRHEPDLYNALIRGVRKFWEIAIEEGIDTQSFRGTLKQVPFDKHGHFDKGKMQFYGVQEATDLATRAFNEAGVSEVLQVHTVEAEE